jgi:hypothetical protein
VGKRQLYSDRDEVLLELHNIVVINGIDIFPSESDLAERLLYFELKKITSDSAISDYDLRKDFEEKRSKIAKMVLVGSIVVAGIVLIGVLAYICYRIYMLTM